MATTSLILRPTMSYVGFFACGTCQRWTAWRRQKFTDVGLRARTAKHVVPSKYDSAHALFKLNGVLFLYKLDFLKISDLSN